MGPSGRERGVQNICPCHSGRKKKSCYIPVPVAGCFLTTTCFKVYRTKSVYGPKHVWYKVYPACVSSKRWSMFNMWGLAWSWDDLQGLDWKFWSDYTQTDRISTWRLDPFDRRGRVKHWMKIKLIKFHLDWYVFVFFCSISVNLLRFGCAEKNIFCKACYGNGRTKIKPSSLQTFII